MLIYPNINPNVFTIGSFTIKWYGVCYLLAFILGYCLMLSKVRCNVAIGHNNELNKDQITDLLFYIALGVIIGGRVGYQVLYNPGDLLVDPITVGKFWLPGRSFHGGLIGVLLALHFYAKKHNYSLLAITNFIAPIVPVGIACGRLGNFINGELYGRVTSVPWGMIFPHVDQLPRHPSQIYEFLLEGVVLFLILNLNLQQDPNHKIKSWLYKINQHKSALFLIFYGLFRILVENYRQPDFDQYYLNWITMGQILSIPMLLVGLLLLFTGSKTRSVC